MLALESEFDNVFLKILFAEECQLSAHSGQLALLFLLFFGGHALTSFFSSSPRAKARAFSMVVMAMLCSAVRVKKA